ncbi:lipid A deacylase LpxR family protein [Tenacibaculum sp. AHE15PA]|uniref:lipid A deacylase LpxR family protein n=1 Tax=unclassified Tenacibaculum TaxID=2635139 RepID=UPI001C4E5A10|nr:MULTISPECIES: lipid A deacylase LpxR family protein [unclassified Tenacibaculum]QXP74209.1 lipid A deacylase LpxR family protein [Tenacibaculum sp. AHE14PA]QXP75421.1 lipid A deacylase LpxR family protein [Tenacibaculum sp. AHE15PA]
MKQKIFFFILLSSISLFSQRKYAKEFSFLNDNDLYISPNQDRYYTNGMFFSYRYLSNNTTEKLEKKIFEIQIGHHMYTPFKAIVEQSSDHDRPFAGYLFGSFGIHRFYKNETIIKTTLQLGSLGPSALSKPMQDFIHEIYGFKKAIGWEDQISDALAVNLKITYIKKLANDNYLDVNWVNNIRIGTVYTDFSTGFYGRIGLKPLQKIINSIAFNANLNNENTNFNNEIESFLYIKPMFSYVAYDATIEGSFLNDSSPITYDIEPFKFTAEIGIRFTANRFNFGYAINYHTKKLKSVRVPKGNFYGTLLFNYQFN